MGTSWELNSSMETVLQISFNEWTLNGSAVIGTFSTFLILLQETSKMPNF